MAEDALWQEEVDALEILLGQRHEANQLILNPPKVPRTGKQTAFVKVSAGAGGQEAQAWAEMLGKAYARWGERHHLATEIVDQNATDSGMRSITIMITGKRVFDRLFGERGIHRLSRRSPFDQADRRQTSFAAVDVSELVPETEVEINETDLRWETFRAGGPGGQHQNKTDSACRLTHEPTGIVVVCRNGRSQAANKKTARQMLAGEMVERIKQQEAEAKGERHSEAKTAGFGQRKRSYVIEPYQLIKDHETGKTMHNFSAILEGDLDVFID